MFGSTDRRISRVQWLVSLARMMTSRFGERPCLSLKGIRQQQVIKHTQCPLLVIVCIHMDVISHTHVHKLHTQTHKIIQ